VEVEKEICKKVAKIYASKNLHHDLSSEETVLVEMLEKGGYLIPNNPENGFVGRATK